MNTSLRTPAALLLGLTACGLEAPDDAAPGTGTTDDQPAELVLASGARYRAAYGGDASTLNPPPLEIQARLAPPQGYVAPHAFCDAYVDAACGSLTACGCQEDKLACYANAAEACRGEWGLYGPEVKAAIDADRLSYDGYAAFRFITDLREATAACAFPLDAFDMDRASLLGFFDVFRGHVDPGKACTLPFLPFRANECAGGLCLDQGAGPTCVPMADLGEPCEGGAVCVDLEQPVEVRDLFDGTLFGRCAAAEGGATVCQPHLKDGRKCRFDQDCASTRCVAERCAPLAQPGEACQSDLHCAVGHCDLGLCADPRRPLDAECAHHAACASGACYRGRCAEPVCRR